MRASGLSEEVLERAAQLLRPIDSKVFWALLAAARRDPAAFLTMRDIASQVWGRDLDEDQVRGNVQRAISEMRNRLAHEVIVKKDKEPSYRLDLDALETWNLTEEFRNSRAEEIALPRSLTVEFLRSAILSQSTLKKLIFWGPAALHELAADSGKLFEVIKSRRAVDIVCDENEGRDAIDLVRSLIDASDLPLSTFHRLCAHTLRVVVTAGLPGSGAAWLDRSEPKSVLQMRGPDGAAARIAQGAFVADFFARLEVRIAQIEPRKPQTLPLILLDPFDSRIATQGGMLANYYCASPFADDHLLIGPLVDL